MKRKVKKQEMSVRYFYVKPKNEEEAKEQAMKVREAFAILFEETAKRIEEKKGALEISQEL